LWTARTADLKTAKSWDWCHSIRPDYLFQESPIVTTKKGTVQPAVAFEDTALKAPDAAPTWTLI
jgi:hypothetical protein